MRGGRSLAGTLNPDNIALPTRQYFFRGAVVLTYLNLFNWLCNDGCSDGFRDFVALNGALMMRASL